VSAPPRTMLAGFVVTIIGLSTLWMGTDGGRAFTSEGARRLRALAADQLVPAATFEDVQNRPIGLRDGHDKVTLIEFIYTTCVTVCQSAGNTFSRLQSEVLADPELLRAVRMISVSFDPANDGSAELRSYALAHEADEQVWKIVRARTEERDALLEAFGVIVIRDPVFGFVHNAAIHVIQQDGHLAGIFDIEDAAGALDRVRGLLGRAP
jgi:protein SCO1/2